MAWLLVILAGLLETGFAVALKYSEGFSRWIPTVLFMVFAAGSFTLLTTALRTLPIGPAYAVWTGVGAVGTVIVGIVFLDESAALLKLVSITLVVVGIAGLQLSTAGH